MTTSWRSARCRCRWLDTLFGSEAQPPPVGSATVGILRASDEDGWLDPAGVNNQPHGIKAIWVPRAPSRNVLSEEVHDQS